MQRSILGARLCQVQQRAKKSHYQSKMLVCVSTNRADAVDGLLLEVQPRAELKIFCNSEQNFGCLILAYFGYRTVDTASSVQVC